MIIFTGLAYLGGTPAYGYTLSLASCVRAFYPEVAFYASLSSDEKGAGILDKLIKERLVFEPSLIKSDKRTMVYGKEEENTAPLCLGAEELSEAISFNSNVKVLLVAADTLNYTVLVDNILSAYDSLEEKPVLLLDIASSSFEKKEGYERNLERVLERAALVLLEEGEEVKGKASITFAQDKTIYADSKGVFQREASSKAEVLGDLLNQEAFGSTLEEAHFEGFAR